MTIPRLSLIPILALGACSASSAGSPADWNIFAGSKSAYLYSAAQTDDGSTYLTGCFEADLAFGDITLPGDGTFNGFLAKVDADGKPLWAKELKGAANPDDWTDDCGDTLAVTGDGGVVIAGQHSGPIDLGGGPLAGSSVIGTGFDDLFLAEFDGDGNHVWSHGFVDATDDGEENPSALAIDPEGNIYLLGGTRGDLDLGGGPRVGDIGGFLAKFDRDGKHLWDRHVGDGFVVFGGAMVLDGKHQPVVTVDFDAPFDVGGGRVTPVNADAAVVAFDGDGGLRWQKIIGGAGYEYATSLAFAADGHVAVGVSSGSSAPSIDGHAVTSKSGNFVATLDAVTGALGWTASLDVESPTSIASAGAKLWVAGATASTVGDGKLGQIDLVELAADGTVASRAPVTSPYTGVVTSLLARPDGTLVLAAQLGEATGHEFDREEIGVRTVP